MKLIYDEFYLIRIAPRVTLVREARWPGLRTGHGFADKLSSNFMTVNKEQHTRCDRVSLGGQGIDELYLEGAQVFAPHA